MPGRFSFRSGVGRRTLSRLTSLPRARGPPSRERTVEGHGIDCRAGRPRAAAGNRGFGSARPRHGRPGAASAFGAGQARRAICASARRKTPGARAAARISSFGSGVAPCRGPRRLQRVSGQSVEHAVAVARAHVSPDRRVPAAGASRRRERVGRRRGAACHRAIARWSATVSTWPSREFPGAESAFGRRGAGLRAITRRKAPGSKSLQRTRMRSLAGLPDVRLTSLPRARGPSAKATESTAEPAAQARAAAAPAVSVRRAQAAGAPSAESAFDGGEARRAIARSRAVAGSCEEPGPNRQMRGSRASGRGPIGRGGRRRNRQPRRLHCESRGRHARFRFGASAPRALPAPRARLTAARCGVPRAVAPGQPEGSKSPNRDR